MDVNDIKYGAPTIDGYKFTQRQCFLDVLFAEIIVFTYPRNDSDETKKDLNQIKNYMNAITDETLNRFQQYDVSLIDVYNGCTFDDEATNTKYKQMIRDIFIDVLPLVYKLKEHYQRPRPWQLAHHYKLKLFPQKSFSAMSASYPSLHATVATVVCEVCRKHFPYEKDYFIQMARDICASRVSMGLNYPTDVEAGQMIAARILDNEEFQLKYGISV